MFFAPKLPNKEVQCQNEIIHPAPGMSEEPAPVDVAAAAVAGDAASVHGSQVGSLVGSRAASIAGDAAPVGEVGVAKPEARDR